VGCVGFNGVREDHKILRCGLISAGFLLPGFFGRRRRSGWRRDPWELGVWGSVEITRASKVLLWRRVSGASGRPRSRFVVEQTRAVSVVAS
jgi:hypothetical protein